MCPVIFPSVAHPSWQTFCKVESTDHLLRNTREACGGKKEKTVESESIGVKSREYVLLTCLLGNTYAGGKAWKILVYKSWLRFSNSLNLSFYFQYTR